MAHATLSFIMIRRGVGWTERERERHRERETDRHTETDTQRQTESVRQTDR